MIPNDLIEDPGVNSTAFRVYGVVASLAWPKNSVEGITQADVGEPIGLGPQAVNRAFKLLKDHGWLTVERIKDDRGMISGSRYTLPRQPTDAP
jgi:hypothetical protein